MTSKWNDKEVIELFKCVEKFKEKSKSIKEAFSLHAKKFDRKPNSVRNYYYHEVDNLLKDSIRLKALKIDISKHQKQDVKFFSENEGEKIISAIDNLVKKGNSVRQACLKLSGGNVALMLRYQNKYRNQNVKKDETGRLVNILDFKNKQKVLTDSDINSLFMGFVKLVKKTAYDEASQSLKAERNSINFLLKKTVFNLSKREKEVEDLKNLNEKLKKENEQLLLQLTPLKKLERELSKPKDKKLEFVN